MVQRIERQQSLRSRFNDAWSGLAGEDAAWDDRQPSSAFRPVVVSVGRYRSPDCLRTALRRLESTLFRHLHGRGAVLLRGCRIRSPKDLEWVLSGLEGLTAMTEQVVTEAGRDHLPGARSVYCTNSLYRTGGGLGFTGLHSENFYSPEVPRYLSFYCADAPWFGGETALVNMAMAYAELSDGLRRRLESSSCLAHCLHIGSIADEHGVSQTELTNLFRELGFPVVAVGSESFLAVVKPTVMELPDGRRSFQANVSAEAPLFDASLMPLLGRAFQTTRWAGHRFLWEHPEWVERWSAGVARLSTLRRRSSAGSARSSPRPPPIDHPSLAHLIRQPKHSEELARASYRYMTLVGWRRGDLLLFDNMQLQHAGMPGAGPRTLWVQMFNPQTVYAGDTGIARVMTKPGPSLLEQLRELRGRRADRDGARQVQHGLRCVRGTFT